MLGISKNWMYTSFLFFFLLILLYLGGLASSEILIPFLFFTIVVILIITALYLKGQTFNITNLSTKQKLDFINDELRQLDGGEANCFVWKDVLVYEKRIYTPKHKGYDFFAIKGIPASVINDQTELKHIAIYNVTSRSLSLYECSPSEYQRSNPFYNFKPFEDDNIRARPEVRSGSEVNVNLTPLNNQNGAINNG